MPSFRFMIFIVMRISFKGYFMVDKGGMKLCLTRKGVVSKDGLI